MKMPNGYGSVYKMGGNRRKPWTARITVECVTEGIQVKFKYKYLGTWETRSEALVALAKYNECPYDLDADSVTLAELYEKWSSSHYPKISANSVYIYRAAYKVLSPLHGTEFSKLRLVHLQGIIDHSDKNYPTLLNVKLLLSLLYDYAIQNDICNKNYAQYVDVTQYKHRNPDARPHTALTTEELNIIWDNHQHRDAKSVLIMIYTGLRISEFCNIKKSDVHISERYFDVTKSKTNSGIRSIPISDKMLPFFQYWMNEPGEYLITDTGGNAYSVKHYRNNVWRPFLFSIGIASHLPHDARHTFVSLLTAAGVDDKIIKRLVGHKGKDVTETVYTHFELDTLLKAINRI